jgi:hypothetical protein
MMSEHSAVVVALALEYQVVAAGVTLVPDVTESADDEAAVAAAAAGEAAVGAVIVAVASQPANNHTIRR